MAGEEHVCGGVGVARPASGVPELWVAGEWGRHGTGVGKRWGEVAEAGSGHGKRVEIRER